MSVCSEARHACVILNSDLMYPSFLPKATGMRSEKRVLVAKVAVFRKQHDTTWTNPAVRSCLDTHMTAYPALWLKILDRCQLL